MSDLLQIGATGVKAYQTALNVVGQNIANASTKGYVRREANLTELAPGAGQYLIQINRTMNGGVDSFGVDRQFDAFRAADVRNSTAEANRTGSTIIWLERIEKVLSGGDVSGAMTRFFNAGEGIAADPTGTAPRSTFLDAAYGVATAFTITAQSLTAIDGDLQASAALAAEQLNGFAAGLAEANAGLVRAKIGSNEQAQLLDQRDRMIDAMSELVSINVQTDDKGIATVRLNEANGPLFVTGQQARTLGVSFNNSGAMALAIDPKYNPEAVVLRGGTIAGFGEAAARLSHARAQTTQLAQGLAEGVNQVQAAGVDLDGQPGAAIFDASADDGALIANALNIRQVAAARPWTVSSSSGNAGSSILQAQTATSATPLSSTRFTIGAGMLSAVDPVTNSVIGTAAYMPGAPVILAGLTVTISGTPADGDSFTVAATRSGSRDNGNLQSLAALRSNSRFEGQANDLVTANASALSARKQVAEAQGVILEGAAAARDAASGVNLDNEAVDLMRFQQAYQASSRIIQVSRDIFQSLLDSVG